MVGAYVPTLTTFLCMSIKSNFCNCFYNKLFLCFLSFFFFYEKNIKVLFMEKRHYYKLQQILWLLVKQKKILH